MSFKSCHFENLAVDPFPSNKVVVVGASSFVGYHAAMYLKDTCDMLVLENIINLPSAEGMAWLRWKSLLDNNLAPKYLNLTNKIEFTEILLKHDPGMIVFVPSPIFNGYHDKERPFSFELSHLSASLRDFVSLLEIVRFSHPHTRVVLFSLSNLGGLHSLQKAWLKCFELALSSFEGLYGLRTGIVRVDGVDGTLQNEASSVMCYNVSEVMKILHYILKDNNQCVEHEFDPCSDVGDQKSGISHERVPKKSRNIVMTTYFTDVIDPQHPYHFLANSFLLLSPFLKGPIALGLDVVIFHNALSEEFQSSVKKYYKNIEFIKSDISGRTPNDKRFYLYYDYLLENLAVDHVIMTDMRDVQFFNDPFKMMKVMGDQLYVGLDLPWFVDASSQGYVHAVMKMCYGKQEADSTSAKSHPFINAGVVGGSRQTVLSALYKLIQFLNKTHKQANCNMGAINIVFHRYFGHKLYGGYPIQSGFKAIVPGPQGIAVKHKASIGWS